MNAAAALLVAVAFSGVTWGTPWRSALDALGVAFLFASCIGPLCALAMPRLSPIVLARFPFPINWTILVAAMVGFGVTGSLVAIGILRAFGYIATNHLMWIWFARSVKVSIIVTLIFGI